MAGFFPGRYYVEEPDDAVLGSLFEVRPPRLRQ